MITLLMVLHITICVLLVLVVLVQPGKDGGLGMMAGGSSQTIFGSSGGANFFTKFTSATAAIFMVTSILLTIYKSGNRGSVFDRTPPPPAQPTTAVPTQQPVTSAQATSVAPTPQATSAASTASPAATSAPTVKQVTPRTTSNSAGSATAAPSSPTTSQPTK